MEVPKDLFGPEVNATFPGVALRQFNDGDSLRPEEKKQGDDPEPDGHAAIGGDRGNNVQIEDGDDEQQDQVEAAEDALQVWLVRIGGGRQK